MIELFVTWKLELVYKDYNEDAEDYKYSLEYEFQDLQLRIKDVWLFDAFNISYKPLVLNKIDINDITSKSTKNKLDEVPKTLEEFKKLFTR